MNRCVSLVMWFQLPSLSLCFYFTRCPGKRQTFWEVGGEGEGQGSPPAPQKLLYEILLPLSGNTGGLVGDRLPILDAHALTDTEQAHFHGPLGGEIAALSLLAEVAVVPELAEKTGAAHIRDAVLGK